MKESLPSSDNYELQQLFLQQKQAEMSAMLFELGVTPRLLGMHGGRGDKIASRGVDMLNVQCFPVRKKHRTASGDEVTVMNLCVRKTESETSAVFYKYIPVGTVDSSGVVIYPLKNIEQDDAEAVLMAGLDVAALKDSGELPDLDWSLQRVNNPHTGIRRA